MKRFLIVCAACLPALFVSGQNFHPLPVIAQSAPDPVKTEPVKPELIRPPRELPWSRPADAIHIARIDAEVIRQRNPEATPFLRWIWIRRANPDEFKAVSDGINKISRATTTIRPVPGGGILLRIDLRWYAPIVNGSANDLNEWLELWEQLAFDPYFSRIITGDTIKILTDRERDSIRIPKASRWHWQGGKWVEVARHIQQWSLKDLRDIVAERTTPNHLIGSGIDELQAMTGSVCPVVDSGYFLTRALSTIKDRDKINGKDVDNLYSLVWGGLYYEFAGIRKSQVKGRTDLDQVLLDIGVGSDKENFRQLFDRLRSDSAVAMYRSEVTAKKRRVLYFAQLGARLSESSPVFFITEDIRRQDVDFLKDTFRNLLGFKPAAFRAIWTGRNGQQRYALLGADGQLLEKAADNVASDHDIPSPQTTELQSAISCIRCHYRNDGWHPLRNDARTMQQYARVFGDRSNLDQTIPDTLDRIKGLYDGDPARTLERARDDYARAVLTATVNWATDPSGRDATERNKQAVKLASIKIAEVWARERFDVVDAARALREMGVIPKGDGLEQIRALLLPVQVVGPPAIIGIIEDDPTFIALRSGVSVNYDDWQLAFSEAIDRVQRNQEFGKNKVLLARDISIKKDGGK